MPSIVCVVVHPSRIFREGLTSILAKSPFAPTCTAASTDEVPSTISDAGEQLLVLIGVSEGRDLPETLNAAKATFPDAYVVVFGDASKRENVITALEMGATSFVDENVATSTLLKELELVALGEPVISVFILKQLLAHDCTLASDDSVATPTLDEPEPPDTGGQVEQQLSGREVAILNGLLLGASNKVIAYQLKITEATVKVHVKAILRKIRVRNRTQAAIWALNHRALPKRLSAGNGGSPVTHARPSKSSN